MIYQSIDRLSTYLLNSALPIASPDLPCTIYLVPCTIDLGPRSLMPTEACAGCSLQVGMKGRTSFSGERSLCFRNDTPLSNMRASRTAPRVSIMCFRHYFNVQVFVKDVFPEYGIFLVILSIFVEYSLSIIQVESWESRIN